MTAEMPTPPPDRGGDRDEAAQPPEISQTRASRKWVITDTLIVAAMPPLFYAACFMYETGYLQFYGIPTVEVLLPAPCLAQIGVRILATLFVAFVVLVLGDFIRTQIPNKIMSKKILWPLTFLFCFPSPYYAIYLGNHLSVLDLWFVAVLLSTGLALLVFGFPGPAAAKGYVRRNLSPNALYALTLLAALTGIGGANEAAAQEVYLVGAAPAPADTTSRWILLRAYSDRSLLVECPPSDLRLSGKFRYIDNQELSRMTFQATTLGRLSQPRVPSLPSDRLKAPPAATPLTPPAHSATG